MRETIFILCLFQSPFIAIFSLPSVVTVISHMILSLFDFPPVFIRILIFILSLFLILLLFLILFLILLLFHEKERERRQEGLSFDPSFFA